MLADRRWCGVGVETSVAWPTELTKVVFEGRELTLRPAAREERPSLELDFDSSLSFDDAHSILRRYLSLLAWSKGFPIREVAFLSGGQRVGFGNRPLLHQSTENFFNGGAQLPADKRARLALSLYREALGLDSVAYQVLGFFKILNITCKNSDLQQKWIAAALPHLVGTEVLERIRELATSQPNIPKYLYHSCRCAVAHASANPLVDPDAVTDDHRLRQDLPLIRALAERMMVADIGIERRTGRTQLGVAY
jgi:hypothetical protein